MVDARRYYQVISSHVNSVEDLFVGAAELFRFLVFQLRFLNRDVQCGLLFIHRAPDIRIGPRAQVRIGFPAHFMEEFTGHFYGKVTMGNNVFFNRGCYISIHDELSIGDDCLFGERVSIHDENHPPGRGAEPIADRGFVTNPITIGNNVWIGAKATILQGVRIGDNAVVGANAVVTKDIPAYCIAVGVPARVIREI